MMDTKARGRLACYCTVPLVPYRGSGGQAGETCHVKRSGSGGFRVVHEERGGWAAMRYLGTVNCRLIAAPSR